MMWTDGFMALLVSVRQLASLGQRPVLDCLGRCGARVEEAAPFETGDVGALCANILRQAVQDMRGRETAIGETREVDGALRIVEERGSEAQTYRAKVALGRCR